MQWYYWVVPLWYLTGVLAVCTAKSRQPTPLTKFGELLMLLIVVAPFGLFALAWALDES